MINFEDTRYVGDGLGFSPQMVTNMLDADPIFTSDGDRYVRFDEDDRR